MKRSIGVKGLAAISVLAVACSAAPGEESGSVASALASPLAASATAVAIEPNGVVEAFFRDAAGTLFVTRRATQTSAWSRASELGSVASDPAVIVDGRGVAHLFVRAPDGSILHRAQSGPAGAWCAAWRSLGGNVAAKPAAAINADGRLEVFGADGSGALVHAWETTAYGDSYSAWERLGGNVASAIAVGANADGRLEIVARGADGALGHVWQMAPNAGWSSWSTLGGAYSGDPALARDVSSGALAIFAVTAGGAPVELRQDPRAYGGWLPPNALGGAVTSSLAASPRPGGGFDVFARAANGAIAPQLVLATGDHGSWGTLGGALASAPTVAREGDGSIDVVAATAGRVPKLLRLAADGTVSSSWSAFASALPGSWACAAPGKLGPGQESQGYAVKTFTGDCFEQPGYTLHEDATVLGGLRWAPGYCVYTTDDRRGGPLAELCTEDAVEIAPLIVDTGSGGTTPHCPDCVILWDQ